MNNYCCCLILGNFCRHFLRGVNLYPLKRKALYLAAALLGFLLLLGFTSLNDAQIVGYCPVSANHSLSSRPSSDFSGFPR